MRILLVAPMAPDADSAGAIPRVLHAQLTGLRELGHDLSLAVIAGPEDADLAAADRLVADGVAVHVARRVEPHGADRWRRRRRLAEGWLRGRWPWRTVWFWDPYFQGILDGLLEREPFDVIAVQDNAMGVYNYGWAAPNVLTEFEVHRPRPFRVERGSVDRLGMSIVREVDWQRWPRYQRATWQRFSLVQAFTPRDADLIRSRAPDIATRVRVNPFGLDLPEVLPFAPESSREIAFVGNFTHAPNVDGALWLGTEIMPRLRALGTGARLTVIGPWPPAAVEALACDDVRVMGRVADVRPFLAEAAVVLAPLRIGGGMRMKVLEAMALGKAVVTTSRGAEGLKRNDELPLEVANTSDEIATVTARLLADSQLRSDLGARARAFVVKRHSARAYARRLEQIFEEARELRAVRGKS
jgi:glycosyltransferase involved in cell wall biosynthesis